MKIRCFTIFRFHKDSIHFLLYLHWLHHIITQFVILLYNYTFIIILFFILLFHIFCILLYNIIKFSDVSPALTCASAISNFWSICVGVHYLIPVPYVSFPTGNISLLKPLRTFSSFSLFAFLRVLLFPFCLGFFV